MIGIIDNFSFAKKKIGIKNDKGATYWYEVPNDMSDLFQTLQKGQEVDYSYITTNDKQNRLKSLVPTAPATTEIKPASVQNNNFISNNKCIPNNSLSDIIAEKKVAEDKKQDLITREWAYGQAITLVMQKEQLTNTKALTDDMIKEEVMKWAEWLIKEVRQ